MMATGVPILRKQAELQRPDPFFHALRAYSSRCKDYTGFVGVVFCGLIYYFFKKIEYFRWKIRKFA
jgi:hypothetical protein